MGTALGLAGLSSRPSAAQSNDDIPILNAAIDLEHQAIWAYAVAAGKLSDNVIGKTILSLATRNLRDHEEHRDVLMGAVSSLGGTPSAARDSYDLSSYISAREGNLDSDANIAKLALALEVDATLAYGDAFSQLKTPGLLAAAATIAPDESAHATAIRAILRTLDPTIAFVPAAFLSADTRDRWILKI
ncbi:ferritin-like domain-containing protein [Synechococcus sp. PCC 7336]|uniref:ferritin-like domain-containing protein n=1 Tax=Synechococcus sp. PCC 7336 TaxID=195250 RepID=UPI0003465E95|nr:ferritin-like domain-containing protein [Synechococcus sp. PCC 7336]